MSSLYTPNSQSQNMPNSVGSFIGGDPQTLIARIHQLEKKLHECQKKVGLLLIEKEEQYYVYKDNRYEVEKEKDSLVQEENKLNKEKESFNKEKDKLEKNKDALIRDKIMLANEKETLEEEHRSLEMEKENLDLWKVNFEDKLKMAKEEFNISKNESEEHFQRQATNICKMSDYLDKVIQDYANDRELLFQLFLKPKWCFCCGRVFIGDGSRVVLKRNTVLLLNIIENKLLFRKKPIFHKMPIFQKLDSTTGEWGTSLRIKEKTEQLTTLEERHLLLNTKLKCMTLARQAEVKKEATKNNVVENKHNHQSESIWMKVRKFFW